MYLQGFPVQYDSLRGVPCHLGRFPSDYGFLEGLGSSNTDWVNGYQNPFNKGPLARAAALAATDKAGAYAILAPAFSKIQADAVAFIQTHGSAGQKTIDGWKQSDFPLINGFLSDWAQAAATVPQAQFVSTIPADVQPALTAPAIGVPIYSPGGGATYIPAAGGGGVVNVTAPAAGGGDLSSMLTEWGPWLAGAAVLGFLLSSKGRPRQAG